MATLRRREDRDGKYELDYVDVDGKRYRVNTGTSNKRLAELWIRKVEDLLTQARLGIIPKVGRIDADVVANKKRRKESLQLQDFKDKYEDRARYDLEQSEGTINIFKLAISGFIEIVGNKVIADITDDDVIKWKKKYGASRTKTTLSMHHRSLRASFNKAVKWGMAEQNPFANVEVSKPNKPEKTKDMTFDEVKKLLKKIKETGDTKFGIYVRFLLYTGCRRNEILFLRWEDINLDKKSLVVYQDKVGGRKLELPINKALQKVIDGMEFVKKGFVFQTNSNSRGAKFKEQPWHEDFVSRKFKKYIRDYGFPKHYTLHSLRHTFSTYLLEQGVPIDIIQKLLGHSSVRVTSENYDHSVALHFRAQMDLVDFEG